MKKYIKYFEKKKKEPVFYKIKYLPALSKKQIIALSVLIVASAYNIVQAQFQVLLPAGSIVIKSVIDIFTETVKNAPANATYQDITVEFIMQYNNVMSSLDPFRFALQYISEAQLSSISIVNSMPFANSGIFSHIESALTIFACIACAYKIVVHFIKTERHDNLSAIFGYFPYFGILLLFTFSNQIVSTVSGLNQNINTRQVSSIASKINASMEKTIRKDLNAIKDNLNSDRQKLQNIAEAQSGTGFWDISDKASMAVEAFKIEAGALVKTAITGYSNAFKLFWFSLFGVALTSILSVPTFVMSLMVKVLLSVMLAGTKIVFLLAFVPGFDNLWKTFLMNMLNIVLWVPIFNVIISFIISIVLKLTTSDISLGQLIWLLIVAFICATKAISLTTTCANMIVNGAGAGMAGAMGSMATMTGIGAVAGATKAVVGAGTKIATGGVAGAMAGKAINSKLEKE